MFTLQTLASYNGRNGAPAYIAVQGTVYDVTNVSGWSGGSHHGISAGQDLSVAFSSSPHSYSILSMAKIVGSLVLDPNDPTNAVDAVSSATVRPTGGQEFDDDEHEHENEDHDEYEHEEDDDDEHEDEHEEDDD